VERTRRVTRANARSGVILAEYRRWGGWALL
jgi:hypothetical protein